MQATVLLVLVSAAVVQSVSKLPSWITPCYRDDPDFDACAVRNGQPIMARFVQGDRKLGLPVLVPLTITEMRIGKGTNLGLEIVMSDTKVHGLDNIKITKYHIDFKTMHMTFSLLIPHAELITTYEVSGRILILPITGKGPGNITLENVDITYSADFDLIQKNSKEHMRFKNDKMTFTTSHVYVKLENLFNGDKLLGDNMNDFLNDNWRILVAEIGPGVAEALGAVVTNIFQGLAVHVPYNDFVPLKPTT